MTERPKLPKPPPLPAQRALDDAVRRLGGGEATRLPDKRNLMAIAIVGAADVRDAVSGFTPAGKGTAQAEREYRTYKGKVSRVITYMIAEGMDETPDRPWSPLPPGMWLGPLGKMTAKQREILIDELSADARYERDCAAVDFRQAGKAMDMMEKIVSLMQTLIRSDDLAEQMMTSLDTQLAGQEPDPY